SAPGRGAPSPDAAGGFAGQSFVIAVYFSAMRLVPLVPKSIFTTAFASTSTTVPSPYESCVTRSPISRLGTSFWTEMPPNPPEAPALRCGENGLAGPPDDADPPREPVVAARPDPESPRPEP